MNQKNVKISVMVPVFNSEKTLDNCLKSLISQKEDFFELVVVDNNSTDSTSEIIRSYEKKYSFVKYVFESKRGRGSARNAGINACNGNIICMTDADCTVPKNWIKKITRPIIKGDEVAVMGSQKDGIKNYWTKKIQKIDSELISKKFGKYVVMFLDTKNFAIDSKLMKKYMFNSKLKSAEDRDLFIRLSPKYKILFLRDVFVTHHHHFNFSETVRIYYWRAFYLHKSIKGSAEITSDKDFLKEKEIFSFRHLFGAPGRLIVSTFKHPSDFWYLFITGLSWRIGALCGRLSK